MAAEQSLTSVRDASLRALYENFRREEVPVHHLSDKLDQPFELIMEALFLAKADGFVELDVMTEIHKGTPVPVDGYVRLLPAGVRHVETPPSGSPDIQGSVHIHTTGSNSPVFVGSGTQQVTITQIQSLEIEAVLKQIEDSCLEDDCVGKQEAIQVQKSVEAFRAEAKSSTPVLVTLKEHISRIASIAKDSTLIAGALVQLRHLLGLP